MTASAIVSALHVLALGIGLPAIYLRGRALKALPAPDAFRRLFAADNVWGLAAALWIVTGLLRAFAGLEKGSQFYLASPLFWTKMALFVLVIALEIWPMTTFIAWRRRMRRGERPDTARAGALHGIGHAQMALVILMVFVAAFMARGFAMR
jgi:putative membrane protein